MRISTNFGRIVPVIAILFSLFTANRANAQCNIAYTSASSSLPLEVLSPVGTADVVLADVSPLIAFSCSMPMGTLQFSDDANFTGTIYTGTYPLDCGDLGMHTFYVRAIDASMTPSIALSLTVEVIDNEDPTVGCPAPGSIFADAGQCYGTFSATIATFGDNCAVSSLEWEISGATTAASGSNQMGGRQFNVGTSTATYTASDASGNTATCSFTVTVTDNQAPSITCPANMTVAAGFGCQTPVSYMPMMLNDNCTTVSATASPASGSTFSLGGPTTVTFTATDGAMLTSTCTFTVTVTDQTAPVFSAVPVNATINTSTGSNPNDCVGDFSYNHPTVLDSCDMSPVLTYQLTGATNNGGPVSFTSGGPSVVSLNLGTTTFTYTATDIALNTRTTSFTVTVVDQSGPRFNVFPPSFPGDTIWCGRSFVLNNTNNNCSNSFTWRRPNSAIVYRDVTDCNLSGVTENILPATVAAALQSTGYNYFGNPAAVHVTAQLPVGQTIISYLATDFDGNTSVCSFTVTVNDVQAPSIICPPNTTLNTTCPDASIPDYRNGVNIFDNCQAAITIKQTPSDTTQLSELSALIGTPNTGDTIRIHMMVTDGPNSANCSFLVTLQDGTAPIPNVIPLPSKIDSCGRFTMPAPSATDPCNAGLVTIYGTPTYAAPSAGIIFTPASGSNPPTYTFPVGVYDITWLYTDGNNNFSTQSQSIRVLADTFPPVALCRALINVPLQADGDTTITTAMINNGSYDPNNCGPITFSLSKTVFTCANLDTNNVVLTVTDNNGRTATCTSKVVIKDITAPTLVGVPADTTIKSCAPIPPPAVITATDVCDNTLTVVDTSTSTQTAFGCSKYSYTITRNWSVTDDSGNSRTARQIITVVDDAPSMAALPDSIVVVTGPNRLSCSDTVRLDYQSLITDCIPGLRFNLTGGFFPGIYGVGMHNVTISATDSCNHTSTKAVKIIVRDGTPPQAVCINGISTTVGPGGQAIVTHNQINNNSFDYCAIPQTNVTLDTATYVFTCAQADGVTQHPVSLTVRDVAGNTSTCTTYVIVQDNVKPTLSCPANITVQCNQSTLPGTTGTATATDNCPGTLSAITYSDSTLAGSVGTCSIIRRRWSVTDISNNLGTCLQLISVRDTISPTISALPVNDTIECYKNIPAVPTVTATDNCDLSVDLAFVQDTLNRAAGVCGKYNYTVRRRWTATDDCGLISTASYFIMVRDTVRPSFPGMPDTVRVFSANYPTQTTCVIPYAFDAYAFLSECADSLDLAVSNNAPLGNSKFRVAGNYAPGTYKVRFDVTDPCGNFGRDSVVFIFIDNSAPTVICQTSVDVALGTNGTGVITVPDVNIGTVDNCGIDTMFLSKYSFNCSNLGQNSVFLTAIDNFGNSNSCPVNVNVTVGTATVFSANVTGNPTTYFGASTGSATATITQGTGTFTYLWSNNATTSSINNVPAGTYTVTISNTASGCVQVDTAIVDQGPKVKITVADVVASVGQTVLVPVTASQFININSMSFALATLTPGIAVVNDLVDIHPSLSSHFLYGINANVITAVWVDPAGIDLLNLPNNTVLFNIQATAVGAINTQTDISVGALGTVPFEIIQQFGSTSTTVPIDTMYGSISISQSAQNQLGGLIATWINPDVTGSVARPVANVIVSAGVVGVQNDTTAADGIYDLSVPTATNSLTSPIKYTAGNTNITSADRLRIVNHIFGTVMMSPYQQIAANVNNDTLISLGDHIKLGPLVLGQVQHLDTMPDWIFIPKSFTFPTVNPATGAWLKVNYPRTIAHTPLLQNYLNDDFVAIRRGDVNGNTPVTIVQNIADDRYESDDALVLAIQDRILVSGEKIEIPVEAVTFKNRQAFQGTFAFDPSVMQFDGINAGQIGIQANDFGTARLFEGFLTTSWVNRNTISLASGESAFSLKFKVQRGGMLLSEVLSLGSQVTRAESYNASIETTPIELRFLNNGIVQGQFELQQSRPNPATDRVEIGFMLPATADATLRVINLEGKVVRTISRAFNQGYNQISFSKSELGGAGVYIYELVSGSHTARRKMVFID